MDLIPIGRAAARLGMSTSALRYYDERKLVCPSARLAGKQMYGAEQLRRLAFIKSCTGWACRYRPQPPFSTPPARSGARPFGSRSPSWIK